MNDGIRSQAQRCRALAAILVTGLAWASVGLAADRKDSASVVTAEMIPAVILVDAEGRVEFEIRLTIAEGTAAIWHIYGHGQRDYIGLEYGIDHGDRLRDLRIIYPHGHSRQVLGETVRLIEGTASIRVTARLAPCDESEIELSSTLRFQACDDAMCLAPAAVPIDLLLICDPAPAGLEEVSPEESRVLDRRDCHDQNQEHRLSGYGFSPRNGKGRSC